VGVITYGELILTVNGQETGTVPRTPNTRRDSRKLPRRSSSGSTGRDEAGSLEGGARSGFGETRHHRREGLRVALEDREVGDAVPLAPLLDRLADLIDRAQEHVGRLEQNEADPDGVLRCGARPSTGPMLLSAPRGEQHFGEHSKLRYLSISGSYAGRCLLLHWADILRRSFNPTDLFVVTPEGSLERFANL
jgi:hypothetical protein